MIHQAQENLAPGGSRITKVLVDHGFLDGQIMWWLDKQGIAFVVPARKDMLVHRAARPEARRGQGTVQRRQREITYGHGKKQRQKTLETEVVGITGLNLWEQYSAIPPGYPRQRVG